MKRRIGPTDKSSWNLKERFRCGPPGWDVGEGRLNYTQEEMPVVLWVFVNSILATSDASNILCYLMARRR